MKWEKVKLSEVTEYITDGDHQPAPKSDSGVLFVKIKDIQDNCLTFDNALFVPQEYYNQLPKNRKAVYGDTLYTVVGSYGIPAFVNHNIPFCFERNIALLHPNNRVIPKYLYYAVKNPIFYGNANNIANGSAQKLIPLSKLAGMEVSVPPIERQETIVNILSAYDELIENNQKQIKLLEEAAQRLYKEWFVDLRFPGHETTPIVDGVPEGWKQLALEQITPILTGKKDANFSTEDGRYPFFTCAQAPLRAPSYSFDCNAVILAGNGDFNVKLYRGKFEAYQRTYVLSPECTEYLYLLYHAVNNSMVKLSQAASGSTIKFLTKGMIASIPVYTPEVKNLEKFNTLSEAIQKQIEVLKKSIANATEARNRLLPKLMSGEIEV